MKLKRFKQFYEAIYASKWQEEYDETYCTTFDLDVNDKFEIKDGKNINQVYYVGKTYDDIFFTYDINGIVYKIPKDELEIKFIKKL